MFSQIHFRRQYSTGVGISFRDNSVPRQQRDFPIVATTRKTKPASLSTFLTKARIVPNQTKK